MHYFYFLYYLPLLLAFYVLTTKLVQKILNYPPTPFFSIPIFGHLYLFINKPLARTLAKLSQVYGPVILFNFGSRPVLVISSPSAAEECFRKNDLVFADRPDSLVSKVLGYNNTALLVARYGPHWHNLRKISAVEVFSSQRLNLLSTIRHDEVKSLIRRLHTQSSDGEVHDRMVEVEMKTVFSELMYNVMMRMITGDRSYYGDSDKGKKFMKVVEDIFMVAELPNIGDFVPFWRKLKFEGYVEKTIREVHEESDCFLQEMIEEQRSKMFEDKQDARQIVSEKGLIEVLLSLQSKEPQVYTDQIIKGLVVVLIIAGVDTTATTMEWALTLLLNNHAKLVKAQAEISKCVGYNRLVNESDLSHLPYLHCIIKETLRMYPAAPLLVPHESSSDCTVEGYRVPRGTMLLANVWAIHNDPKLWDEPRNFKPERFEIEGTKENRVGYKLMPFGSGRRACPGEGLAMRMIGLTLGSLLQGFELERISEEIVDVEEGARLTMPKINALRIKLRPHSVMLRILSQI